MDLQTARQVATNFWNVVTGQHDIGKWTNVTDETSFQELYLFARQDGKGFVIVAADDCVQPILGYSTDGRLITPLPPSVSSFLKGYENEIIHCKRNNILSTTEIISQWTQLLNGEYTPQNTTAVAPLLTTTWAQRPYYNNLCPDSSGYHTLAGCVAIATAQVMKYWNWPSSGVGSHSYYHNTYGNLYANFGNATYNWNNMPNSLSSSSSTAQVNAVATLVYHVGVAVEMDYGIDGSGAYTTSYGYSSYPCAENALKDYFRYKNTLHSVYRDDVTNSQWIAALNTELNAGRPVIEKGRGDDGGHAFVCDGYDNNGLYHINWGWNGSCNGYFAHNDLNPSSFTFNDEKAIIVGIEPDGQLIVSPQSLNFSQAGGSQTFTVTSINGNYSSWTASSNQSWLTLSPTSGSGGGSTTTVTATATPNYSGSTRTAVVTISQGSSSATLQVTQNECSSSDMCTITVSMEDSYGDGWNNAYLTLSSASGYVYGTASCTGSYTTQQFSICPSDLILTWSSGNYDDECSFTLTNNHGITLMTASNPSFTTYTITSPCSSGSNPPSSCVITSFPWLENFEDGINCWSTIDADGDGENWFLATGSPFSGTHSMASYSWNNGTLNSNNYLVSPQLSLPSTGLYKLTFYVRSANTNYPDTISVRLTTGNGTSASNFTTVLMPLTPILHTTYQPYEIYLTGYNGQTFRLAFVHKSYDGHYLLLDDVSIANTSASYTISVSSASPSMGTATGGGTYSGGATAELTATANSGYRFTGWNDGNTENPRTVTVTGNATYTAQFANLGGSEHHYDNGSFSSTVGAGGTLYWGIRFAAGELSSYDTLSSVKIWDKYAGTYQMTIYQGGSSAPGTQVYTQTYYLSGSEDWYTATLSAPVTINHSQPLWIVFYNNDVSHPAAGSHYAGNPDGSWVSTDNSTWTSVCDYNIYRTWMIRAVLSNSAPAQQYTITAVSANSAMGSASGGGTYLAGETAVLTANANSAYRFTGWNDGSTENPRTVTVTGNATYTAQFANLGSSEHHYDNGSYSNSVGAGGSFSWGIRFAAGELSGYNTLSSVKIWDMYAGTYQMTIYQGGSYAPGTQVYTQTYYLSGYDDWYTATLNSPVTIDHSQPLWIVFYNDDVTYPAVGSTYAGNPDGSWCYTNNSGWTSVCDHNLYYTWMIRAMLTNSAPAQQYTITAVSANSTMGSASGGGTYLAGETAVLTADANSAYRFTGWNDGNTENPRTVTVTGNATYTAQFANLGSSEHHYDNGSFSSTVGAGGTLYWGIRFAAGELSGYNTLSSVKIWDMYAGTYQMTIYQGGSYAPGTQVYTQTYYLSGSGNWYTATLNTPVTIDHSQPLWIVFYNDDVSYPAAGSHYAGNPDGSWASVDNSTWTSVCDYDIYRTWMIRAMLTNSAPAQQYTITAVSANSAMGSASGGGTYLVGETAVLTANANSAYRFTGWNDGNTENPRTVTVTGNATYTAYFANLGSSEHHYDNGSYSSSVGAGGSFSWGIRFAAGELSGYNTLSSVKIWDMYAGTYQMTIYQGGSYAPGTQVYTQTYYLSGSENWYTATLNSPVTIDHSQPLWIVFYNDDVSYPAAGSNYAGNPDGSWCYTNNSGWTSACDHNFYYTWMIRAVLTNVTPPQQYTITVVSANPNMGTVVGGGTFDYGTTILIAAGPFENYEFVRWYDGNTDNPRSVTVTENATYIAEFQPITGVSDFVEDNVEIYSYGHQIYVNHAEGLSVEIFDVTGKLIISEIGNSQDHRVFTVNSSGIYLVRTSNGVVKKVQVIR